MSCRVASAAANPVVLGNIQFRQSLTGNFVLILDSVKGDAELADVARKATETVEQQESVVSSQIG